MAAPEATAAKTLIVVGLVAAGAAAIVSASHEFSHERIAANERARLLESLSSVLDPSLHSASLNPIAVEAEDAMLLGSDEPVEAFVVLDENRAAATILSATAPHGYNAPIRLLIGIGADAAVSGVRVVTHRETPGLGDAIEIRKSSWITQFDGTSLGEPPVELWAVDKDEGQFDAITGATVTARAVVSAVRDALLYFDAHRDALLESALAARDEPGDAP